jgi:NitT/TauT family transport system substrate-binding protein
MDPSNEGGILGTIKNAKTLGEEGGLFTIDAEPASLIAADIVK